MKEESISSAEIGELYFGQLNPRHQELFDSTVGQHTRVRLRELPHYVFWNEGEYKDIQNSLYYKYLEQSWEHYFPSRNTHRRRIKKIEKYIKLKNSIEKEGIKNPLEITIAPDGARILLDGNHRASIAFFLHQDAPCRYVDLKEAIARIVNNKREFYGTKRRGKPYQSIFYGEEELVPGRRKDILSRFKKISIDEDIKNKRVIDLGSNIGMNAMLAKHFGADKVMAIELSPKIAQSALRLSTILDAEIDVQTLDCSKPMDLKDEFDTALCFSLYAHVGDKHGLEKNLKEITGRVLYFEGHEGTDKGDYESIFRHFSNIEQLGFNEDGVHSNRSTRPFFRCEK
ncbi:MAG: hypothetical protein WD883_00490 [Candidatus Colwellbacteria bacterium]